MGRADHRVLRVEARTPAFQGRREWLGPGCWKLAAKVGVVDGLGYISVLAPPGCAYGLYTGDMRSRGKGETLVPSAVPHCLGWPWRSLEPVCCWVVPTWFQHFTELGACAPHSSLETLDPGESTFPGCVVFCFSATSTWCYFQFSLEVQQGESIPFPENFLQKLWDFILLRPFPASRNECFSQGLEEGLPYSSISWSLLVFLLLTCSFLVFVSSFTPPFWPFTEKPHTYTQPLTHACTLTQMAGLIFFFFLLICVPQVLRCLGVKNNLLHHPTMASFLWTSWLFCIQKL